jgi:hypothetical protein
MGGAVQAPKFNSNLLTLYWFMLVQLPLMIVLSTSAGSAFRQTQSTLLDFKRLQVPFEALTGRTLIYCWQLVISRFNKLGLSLCGNVPRLTCYQGIFTRVGSAPTVS